jgi:hypothetical protein
VLGKRLEPDPAPDRIERKRLIQPASPNTGRLLRVNYDGTFTVLADKLDRPTSLNFVCDKAYIVTLAGEVWEVEDLEKRADHDRSCSQCDHRD